jgi:hypothetical protein
MFSSSWSGMLRYAAGSLATEFINVDDANDLEYIAKNLSPGSAIQGYVVPANSGGEGPASPTVSFVLPV